MKITLFIDLFCPQKIIGITLVSKVSVWNIHIALKLKNKSKSLWTWNLDLEVSGFNVCLTTNTWEKKNGYAITPVFKLQHV